MRAIVVYGLLAWALYAAPASSAQESVHLQLAIHEVRKPVIEKILAEMQTPCHAVKTFSPDWDRIVTEFFIFCQALHLGGLDPTFEFKAYPNYARMIKQVQGGKIISTAFTVWSREGDPERVYISDEVLRVGEIELGVFTRPDHAALLGVRSLAELRAFSAVSSETWVVDWETLGRLEVKRFPAPGVSQMFKMVANKRADFTMNSLSSLPDMSRTVDGVKLVPVPDIKIGLTGSRRFMISKKFPQAEKVFDALQIGLEELRRKGQIKVRFEETGFYHPQATDWKKLN